MKGFKLSTSLVRFDTGLGTDDDLNRNKKNSLLALQELLSDAEIQRPDKSDEISEIEAGLKDVEDRKNYVEKFNDLDQLLVNLITDANNEPSNTQNNDWLNRLNNIRTP